MIPDRRTDPRFGRRRGLHTVFLEDLKVKPGDVVTYHARATDVGRGRKPAESRSDIFFLEIKPYEEEFVAADSGAGAAGAQETGLEDLIAQQKDIMAATWKLDARARRGGTGVQASTDIKVVAQAQTSLKNKTAEVAAEMSASLAAQRRRRGPGTLTRPGDDPLPRAIEAMGRAAGELERLKVSPALPHEEQALAELLKAATEIRRRQVAMQQANGGGGNGNRQSPDLSTLFDQELRKQQQTNYEQQSTTADAAGESKKEEQDPLAAIRELARRQEGLSKQQRDLAQSKDRLSAEELKRQLERLTRDQEELRQQAEELSEEDSVQASRPAGQQASRPTGQQANRENRARDSKVRPVHRARRARSSARSPRRCETPPAICAARIRSRPARAERKPVKGFAASNSGCRARGRRNGVARWVICNSRPARSRRRSVGWAMRHPAPLPVAPVRMRAGASPANRIVSPTVRSVSANR